MELNSQLSKQQTNLSQTSTTANQVETMKETMRVTEQKFEEKVKEMVKCQEELERLKRTITDKDYDIAHYQNRCTELEDQMRDFTSISGMGANDETFEAVLRAEFQAMRKKLNDRIESQARELQSIRTETIRERADAQTQIERLNVRMLAMSNRLLKLE